MYIFSAGQIPTRYILIKLPCAPSSSEVDKATISTNQLANKCILRKCLLLIFINKLNRALQRSNLSHLVYRDRSLQYNNILTLTRVDLFGDLLSWRSLRTLTCTVQRDRQLDVLLPLIIHLTSSSPASSP